VDGRCRDLICGTMPVLARGTEKYHETFFSLVGV
jgi:hypothetical protein